MRLHSAPTSGVLLWLLASTRLLAQGTIEGTVFTADVSSAPLRDATVDIRSIPVSTTTDNRGQFRLDSLPPGRYRLRARHIGYYAAELDVRIAATDTVRVVLRMQVAPTTLAPIEVNAPNPETLNPRMAGFNDRRRRGLGEFLGPEELRELEHTNLTQVLRTVGLTIARNLRNGRPFASARRGPTSLRETTCPVQVYVDGILMPNTPEPFDPTSIRLETLVGLEFYTGGARVPVLFERGDARCGVLLLWIGRK